MPRYDNPNDLPHLEEVRSDAYRMLGDTLDVMRSDLRPGTEPNAEQAKAWQLARHHISAAKEALTDVARYSG